MESRHVGFAEAGKGQLSLTESGQDLCILGMQPEQRRELSVEILKGGFGLRASAFFHFALCESGLEAVVGLRSDLGGQPSDGDHRHYTKELHLTPSSGGLLSPPRLT